MMNQRNSFLTRFLALALAVVLVASGFGPAVATRVSADEISGDYVTVGDLVANNYDLTDAEKNLLVSGYLSDKAVSYAPLKGEGLVKVDTETATITAEESLGWSPVDAVLVAPNGATQTVEFKNGVAEYDPAIGYAFSVDVYYELIAKVDRELQNAVLTAPAALKQAVANMDTAKAADVNLAVVAEAIDTLVMLADGIKMGPITILQFQDEAAEAVRVLAAQKEANYGVLDLQMQNAVYDASAAKTENLVKNGAAYNAAVIETYNALKAIASDRLSGATTVDNYLEKNDPAHYQLWMALKKILNDTVAALEPAACQWNVPALAKNADYADLDAMVAALDTVSTVEVKDLLTLAADYITINQGVKNVEYKVVLMVTNNENEVAQYGIESVVLALADGASKADIEAAIAAQGEHWVVNDEAYKAEHFTCTTTALPETLTEDISYVVTYAPKTYTVSYSYAETEQLPYGAVITLPVSENAEQAYDYTVNGELVAEGKQVMVDGDMNIARTSGKAYYTTDLYTVIAANYGDSVAKAILESGALKGNETISVRKPDANDAKALLNLENGILTAVAAYAADYQGLKWVPYTYGTNAENKFNGASTAEWNATDAKVQYILTLSNVSAAKVAEIMELVKTLKAEAGEQISAMDRLVNYYTDMGALNKIMLGGMLGSVAVTDFYPGDAAKTQYMRNYFTTLINKILASNMDGNNLAIYNMLTEYKDVNAGGLRYYYANAEDVIAEVKSLSESLNGLVGDKDKEDSLALLLNAFGYSHYVEKIANLGRVMAEVGAALTVPNAAIDLDNANLGKLLNALSAEGEVEVGTVGAPYLLSDKLNVTDVSRKLVELTVVIGNQSETFAAPSLGHGEIVTADMIAALKAEAAAFAAEVLGAKAPYYTMSTEGDLDALVGNTLTADALAVNTYVPVEYTVNVDGYEAQTITIENLEIKLPRNENHPNYKNVYVIKGAELTSAYYTFTAADLDTLFADGAYSISYTVVNAGREMLENAMEALGDDVVFEKVIDENGEEKIVSFTYLMDGTGSAMANFVMKMTGSGYSYVGLNGMPLVQMREVVKEDGTSEFFTELSVQTLLDAMLADGTFHSQTIIDIANDGEGLLFTSSMQLGDTADELYYEDLKFNLYMTSVPGLMKDLGKVLDLIQPVINFKSHDGMLAAEVNLPDEVYYAYLSTMVDYGTLDKANLNAINNQIAFDFMFDFYQAVMREDINTTTFQNTLEMLDTIAYGYLPNKDLTQYEAAYQRVMNYLRSDAVDLVKTEKDITLSVTAQNEDMNKAIEMLGIDLGVAGEMAKGMIVELKEGGSLTVTGNYFLANANKDYEAVVIDVRGPGLTKKFVMTEDLANFDLHGAAAITLIDDVDGDLTLNAATIIDLNGHTINGNVKANAKTIILDSVIDNAENCGGVNGNISGNLNILAGKYTVDVSKYLRDGYVQNENGAVHNAMYQIIVDNGNVTFEINSNFTADYDGILPDVYTLAANIAVDILANYHTSAALTFNGKTVYDFTVNDILGLLADEATPTAIVNTGLNFVQNGVEEMINWILAELLDFGQNADALANGTAIATFGVQSARWTFDINYVEDGNYLSGGLAANFAVTDEYTINIAFAPTNETAPMATIAGYLDSIVEDETYAKVDIFKPVYGAATLKIGAAADSLVSLYLADEAHITLITMALAYGNPDKAAELVTALTVGKTADGRSLKQVIDAMTLADICESLTAFVNAGSYAAVASKIPYDLPIPVSDKVMEKLYDCFALVATKALNLFADFRGDVTIGHFDADNDGIYVWDPAAKVLKGDKTEGLTGRDYTLDVDYSADLMVKVNLFCRLGDVNHDGKVNSKDAALVLQYTVDPSLVYGYFCKRGAEVNGQNPINAKDAAEILAYSVGNIEKFSIEK